MGFSTKHWVKEQPIMKAILFACLVALAIAEPEAKPKADADPYLLYGGYGLGHYGYGLGLGYYGGYGLGYYGKRSADADAKPDPYYYGGYYGLLLGDPHLLEGGEGSQD